MSHTEKINKLLYTPFCKYYSIEDSIRAKMTHKEFFENIFYMPNFEKEIEDLLNTNHSNNDILEEGISKKDLIQSYEESILQIDNFQSWMNNNDNEIYNIIGSSGCGKSTLIHYYQYVYSNVNWLIFDIQEAPEKVYINGYNITVKYESQLLSKVFSVVSQYIVDQMIVFNNGELHVKNTINNIEIIKTKFIKTLSNKMAKYKNAHEFFSKIPNRNNMNENRYCFLFTDYIYHYFNNLIKEENSLAIIFEILFIFLHCNTTKKSVITFDNLERFIGTTEIYNNEIYEFVSYLRAFIGDFGNLYKNRNDNKILFSKHFQFLLSMRRTSLRMIQSQNGSDRDEHKIDISYWFPISRVLKKRIDWYRNHDVDIENEMIIYSILSDESADNESLRGLQLKLDMLFNFNKRLIIDFLNRIIVKISNKQKIEYFNNFLKNEYNIKPACSLFAARSIINRMILDELQENDDLFKKILTKADNNAVNAKTNNAKIGVGYSRNILTILNNYAIDECESMFTPADITYMKLEDLINMLYYDPKFSRNIESIFKNKGSKAEQEKIAKVIFYMNYCNRRKNNWLQFIDLQYIKQSTNSVEVTNWEILLKIIKEHYSDISVRITNSGRAYLNFIVQSFEYFSCRYNENSLPLLCLIPTVDELERNNIDELECIKNIRIVEQQVICCLNEIKNNYCSSTILFKKIFNDNGMLHSERIILSHRGYLFNFIDCLKRIYANYTLNFYQEEKYQELCSTLNDICINYAKKRNDNCDI